MMARNIAYDDIHVGDRASVSKTISEHDVYAFAGVTGDFNPVHVNAEFAKNSLFKQRAHCPRYDFSRSHFGCTGNRTARYRYDLHEPGAQLFSACLVWRYLDGNG